MATYQFILMITMATIAGPSSAMAQNDDRAASPEDGAQTSDPVEDVSSTHGDAPADRIDTDAGDRKLARRQAQARRHLENVSKLQRAIHAKLKLAPEKSEQVDQIFQEYLEGFNAARAENLNEENSAEGFNTLRAQIMEANESGDETKARSLRKEFRKQIQGRQARAAVSFDRAQEQIRELLNKEQRIVFDQLSKQLRAGSARSRLHPRLRSLSRAALSPTLRLTSKQRSSLSLILREGSLTMSRAGDDAEAIEATYAKVRARVMQKVSEKKRRRIESLVRLYESDVQVRHLGQDRRQRPDRQKRRQRPGP